jgi:tetratricopeptide (TPR) repeat protein
MQMEEADILTVLGEKIRPQTPEKLSRAFLSLGLYWRQIGNYPRAIARFRKAAILDAQSWEACEGLARAFIELATQAAITAERRERLLTLAEEWCTKAAQIGGERVKVLCDRAAIADARRDYRRAVDYYKRAQALDPAIERLSAVYNPACIYAVELREYQNALDELAKIIVRDKVKEWVRGDHDFDGMRNDAAFGSKLAALLA